VPDANFGQLAHIFFPNLKYVVCLAAPKIMAKRSRTKSASVYVSDQNLIESLDTSAFRKMIFGTFRELHGGKDAPRTFADFTDFLAFMANGLAIPTLSQALTDVQTKMAERNISNNVSRVIIEFAPFRDLARFITKHASLGLHILTQTAPAAMEDMIKGKVMALFSFLRKLVAEDALLHNRAPPIRLLLGKDSSFDTVASAPDFYRHLTEWTNMVSFVFFQKAELSTDGGTARSFLPIRFLLSNLARPIHHSQWTWTCRRSSTGNSSETVPLLCMHALPDFRPSFRNASTRICQAAFSYMAISISRTLAIPPSLPEWSFKQKG
jgi:hypothetical protein